MNPHFRTITLPIEALPEAPAPADSWRAPLRLSVDALTSTLGPRQGIQRIVLDRAASTLTVDYDPRYFSLEQLQAFAQQVGLVIGGRVHHSVLDLPEACRTLPAMVLERRLQQIPGIMTASVNALSRTVVVEYMATATTMRTDVLGQLRALGYRAHDFRLPDGWWERNRLFVYTAITGLALVAGWLAERAGVPRAVWTACYVLAYLAGGGFAARNGLNALRQGHIDVDFLMVAAALGAAIIGQWAEGAVLLFLFALSNGLEHYAMDRTRQAIRALMDLRPALARVRRGDTEVMLPVESLEVGDLIDVRPGERLPADGEIITGQSALDQSPITGESIPVSRGVGDHVFAGSINGGGALLVRVDRRAEESTLARIIVLVEEAQSKRAPTQQRLETFEQKYALGIIVFATLVAVVPPLLLNWTWDAAFYRAMTLLVVASPCALVISTPASILSAIAAGARNGVLFKGGAYIESLATVRAVAFDKTGTLTVGKPRVTDVVPLNGWTGADLLARAAAVEARSEHPLAQAIVTAADGQGLTIDSASDLQASVGRGVTATLDGQPLHIGTPAYLAEHAVVVPDEVQAQIHTLESQGKTVVSIGDDTLRGLIAVADTVRPEARAAIAGLKAAGVQWVVMLTGDNPRAAHAIAEAVGVDEVRAELMPEDKVTAIRELMTTYGAVAMVGDGVNDAPALALATVGIAMGAGGTDVALETADVVLMSSDLAKLPYAFQLSRRAVRIVWQNLTFAMTMIVFLIVSALLDVVTLTLGVIGHEGSTVIVVLNGLRLLGYRPARPARQSAVLQPAGAGTP